MKWKLTFRFLATVISVVIIVVFINIIVAISVFIGQYSYNQNNDLLKNFGPEDFVRNFKNYVLSSEENVYVSEEGKQILDNEKAWIQVLDEYGREVYHYKKPKNARLKYTPVEIVSAYKYRAGLDIRSTMFIGEKIIRDRSYSYIIGLPMKKFDKRVFVYDINRMAKFIKISIMSIIFIDGIIALFFGYLFSRGLTKPLTNIINGVEKLGNGNYNVYYRPKGIYRDVYSNVNNLSDILKNNESQRKKLEQMREEWIANISHDIKTPLASIKGYAEILSDDEYEFSKEEIQSYAETINKKSNYIKELVDDLNLTTKLKNKASMLDKKEINLVKLVRRTVIDILNDPKYSDRDINFICKESVIHKEVDDILIKRVINNLLYNALIHNNHNVKIEVKVIKDEKAHIFVTDNGKGMNPEELKHIFDRYYRGTNTGESHKGSGLGMAIAKDIVKAHGGDIKISSTLGSGTKAEVIL
ncbi:MULTISPECIES: sensor histidine kinase [unclassified Sedimentibacter]|uniref:sensor histidine kinase n=1 Tax=unclassified Sedimentibacter TaxID=2649220 RepID=UPI0027DF0B5A|nr:HAMP domain-containing sensor histidine kinase [Sedimentibacter sp. MB35-C1]WMJ77141.1 HAMP domain-containing sensor histidine kinase [Sedimentibacter sp. MB35-C1]